MDDKDVNFESIEGTEDDELSPFEANSNDDSIRSGGDPASTALTEDVEDEN